MRGRLAICVPVACAAALCAPAAASAGFGFEGFHAAAEAPGGGAATQAGGHPYALELDAALATAGGASDGDLRDLTVHMPPGLLVNPTSVAECSETLFHKPRSSSKPGSLSGESCPNQSQVGVIKVDVGGTVRWFGLFNLVPPFGSAAAIGASPFGTPLVFTVQAREADSGLDLRLAGVPQSLDVRSMHLTIWGTPWWGDARPSETHDPQRGNCLNEETGGSLTSNCQVLGAGIQEPESLIKSYATLPTTPCGTPPTFSAEATSQAGATAQAGATIPALTACNKALTIVKVQLMTDVGAARTGLAFNLDVNDGGGILNPGGIARPAIKTAVASLPEGLTINPSLGAGLGVCGEADFARESAGSEPGTGCPNGSKIGTVTVEGALGLAEPLKGSLYLAKPYDNPFGTLLGVYMLARSPRRGLIVKSQGKIEPDPRSGRLVATFDELPRLLYTHFGLTLREGQRSTLVSPTTCGLYKAGLQISSWAEPTAFTPDSSYFAINHGEGGGPCPSGAVPPFHPGLIAGSINPQAGSYTPFYLRMTRSDSEQEIASYSATFPPGLTGRLAGIPYCPDAAIEAAKGRSGAEELASPSCPATSAIGHTIAGYGLGGTLAWAPGSLYLAGPYHGAPLSTVAIDSALVGPFDLGVVVVRSAIRIDPRTAQASIDSSGSDPIPHILSGIPLHLRDIRVYVDRSGFTLNPTSCNVLSTVSNLTGAGANPFEVADDTAASATDRYQLLGCSGLGFSPKVALKLSGGMHRGQFPALRATVTERAGDANIGTAAVALPEAEFLAQGHLRDICKAPLFAAGACPPGSVYGHATAYSPLLAEPLEGPVYLKSNPARRLPDMVAALRGAGGIAIDVVGRIDSVHGGMRGSFEVLPDAPASKFVLTLNGGKRGLLENSEELCAAPTYASAKLSGQNNAAVASLVKMGTSCRKGGKRKGKGKRGRR